MRSKDPSVEQHKFSGGTDSRKAEREGEDDVSDADEYLRKLNGNYEVRA